MRTYPTTQRARALGLAFLAAAGMAGAEQVVPGDDGSEFRRLFEAGQYETAAAEARRLVEQVERTSPPPPEELQVALMNLGLAARRAGDFLAAESAYLRVIELIDTTGRLTSPRLARAHGGLAFTYYDARRYDLAARSFERAILLNRRAEGLFNEDQLPLLDKQCMALTELGRVEDALLARRYALRIVGRKHGEQSLPYARELESLARWYTRVGAYEASRATLRRALDDIVRLKGPQAVELVGPLTAAAENARRWISDPQRREATADEERRTMFHDSVMTAPPSLALGTIAGEGQKALERAVAIVDAQPDPSPELAAGVRAQLGDWYQVRGQTEQALARYRQAWQVAGNAPNAAALRQGLFGAPLLLYYIVPGSWDRYAARPPEEVEFRNLEVELAVTPQGGVRDARAAPDMDEQLAAQVLRAVATARYRPRLLDGEPAETPGVRFVQPYYVLRKDASAEAVTAPPGSDAPPPPPSQGGG